MKSKKLNDYLKCFHVAMPKPRDHKERPPCIPEDVLEAKAKKVEQATKKQINLENDLEDENGGADHSSMILFHVTMAAEEAEAAAEEVEAAAAVVEVVAVAVAVATAVVWKI
ncbi:Nucleolar GTP-binding protein [Abeliophyllum distichum]|uniref:Nucleolar GTP-binding protein n=1 Tax=Abeliophyllum distichum TaxID=126358 RepID=A0ABD1VQM1_9LAMI